MDGAETTLYPRYLVANLPRAGNSVCISGQVIDISEDNHGVDDPYAIPPLCPVYSYDPVAFTRKVREDENGLVYLCGGNDEENDDAPSLADDEELQMNEQQMQEFEAIAGDGQGGVDEEEPANEDQLYVNSVARRISRGENFVPLTPGINGATNEKLLEGMKFVATGDFPNVCGGVGTIEFMITAFGGDFHRDIPLSGDCKSLYLRFIRIYCHC